MSDEYPKVIHAQGITVTVKDAVDEAMWTTEYKPPQGAAARMEHDPDLVAEPDTELHSSLDDVTLEMDNPVYNEPTKKKATKKK